MNIKSLEKKLAELNEPKYRAAQVLKAVFQDNIFDFEKINNIPKSLKEKLKDIDILCFKVSNVSKSNDLKTLKALIELEDKNYIESVLIGNSKSEYTVCISCQVGCPANCMFCATGQNGFIRQLTSEEITDQVLFWKKYLNEMSSDKRITNIVYMGMGEPFLNYDNFVESVKNFLDDKLFNFASRSISVSTAFVEVDKIKKFFKEFSQINLAISLHFAANDQRSAYMPVNMKNNLESIAKFLNYYLENYNRKVLLEYLMLDGINDSETDAKNLIKFIDSVEKNYLLHTNIIPYNSTYKNFKTTPFDRIITFENNLKMAGLNVTLRKSSGGDINAACGQLAGKKNIKK